LKRRKFSTPIEPQKPTFEEVLDIVGVAHEWKTSDTDCTLVGGSDAPFHALYDLVRLDFANGKH
jgi:hypothetical protein